MRNYPNVETWFPYNAFYQDSFFIIHLAENVAPFLTFGKMNTLACVPSDADPNGDVSKYPTIEQKDFFSITRDLTLSYDRVDIADTEFHKEIDDIILARGIKIDPERVKLIEEIKANEEEAARKSAEMRKNAPEEE